MQLSAAKTTDGNDRYLLVKIAKDIGIDRTEQLVDQVGASVDDGINITALAVDVPESIIDRNNSMLQVADNLWRDQR